MKFDFKGIEKNGNPIADFVHLLRIVDDNSLWLFNGLKVEIDPTVNFSSNNVLIRWTDIEEGFNDKIIYYSLEDFKSDFTLLND